jgi:hypothetical protein
MFILTSVLASLAILIWFAPEMKLRKSFDFGMPDGSGSAAAAERRTTVDTNYGSIPLHFEPNVGQVSSPVRFLSRGQGYELSLTNDAAILAFQEKSPISGAKRAKEITMSLAGAASGLTVSGEELLEGKTNYLVGRDPKNWKTDIPNFARVRYHDIYEGIDAVFYGDQGNLEYDWVVRPNARVGQIRMDFYGADSVAVNEHGDLVLTAGRSEVTHRRPVAFQDVNDERRTVQVEYVRLNDAADSQVQRYGLRIGEYDPAYALTIDPVLSYSTYLGGDSETFGTAIAIDSNRSAYIAGSTNSTSGFPLVGALQNQNPGGNAAFVTKLNESGTAFLYSTYITATTITNSAASSIRVDSGGNAYVAGLTQSCNFPTTPGSFLPVIPNCGGNFKGFVLKLNPAGNGLVYGTYLSSPDFLFSGELTGIALDSANNAYITGWTQTATFPTTPGAFKRSLAPNTQNAFVSKLNSSGSALVYSTFIGINTPVPNTDPYDKANAIAVDSAGNAYITGQTVSQNFPVTNNAFQTFPGSRLDAFVTKLNSTGTALMYSTYLGGNGDEVGRAIAVDTDGNAYITGYFDGTNGFPFTPNAFRNGAGENCCASVLNGFLTKVNPTGTALVYSTSLGTERQAMSGNGIAVDNTGSAYVVGSEGISAAYVVNAIQPVSQNNDAFILKMNPAGTTLAYSTHFGGSNGSSIGGAIAIDLAGAAYITGSTNASNFPISPGAPQNTKPGGQNNSSFIAKIATLPSDCPAITVGPQPLSPAVLSRNYNLQLTATGGAPPYTFTQAAGFGQNNLPVGLSLSTSGIISGTPTSTNFASYLVTVQAVDANGCVGIRTFNMKYVQRIPALEVSITGRTTILRARPYRYTIQYTNNGDADVFDIPLYIRVPDFLTLSSADLGIEQTLHRPEGGDTIISSTIPRIRARSSGSTAITITVPPTASVERPDGSQGITMDARMGYGFVTPTPTPTPGSDSSDNRTENDGTINVFFVGSFDPNDKIGPPGAGTARYINGNQPMTYVVNFENLATATAPAQTIVVTDQLDMSKYDLTTFAFGDTTIGSQSFSPQNGRTSFFRDFDLRPGNNIIARIQADLNTTNGLLTWRLSSIDPTTGLPTDEPLAGILPPNTAPPRGEGSVSFRVRLKSTVASETPITNQARIVFDTNAPIDTPVWTNTLDTLTPTSSVQALPPSVPANFTVSWAGTDTGSGIGRYTIYVSDNGGTFTPFLLDTNLTSSIFTGQPGHTYGFYSIATDAAGNREASKTVPDTTTTASAAQPSISGRVLTPAGSGVRAARVRLIDANGATIVSTTSSFGVYQFSGLVPGQTYTLTVSSKRYRFAPRTVPVTSSLTGLDLIGLE